MQVEADVRSCTYIAGGPKSAWSVEGPDSPLSDAGIWEDAGAQEVGEMDKGGQRPPGSTFVYSEAAPTGGEAEAGQVPSAGEEVTPTSSSSPEASDERTKPWSPEGGRLPNGQQTPTRTCRSWSVSEQEAKGARTQSQRIAAQLTTPPSPNSKGVLLFNRRKKRVNEFTQRGPGSARPADGEGGEPGGRVGQEPSEEPGLPYFEQQAGMEEEEARLEGGVEAKAGGEDQQAAARLDPNEDYLELPVETRRREAEAEAFRPGGLPPPPPVARPGKTGLLEQPRLRAAGRRPMFTFHERPRLAPNPELLSLVRGTDVQRKGGGSADDGLGLGAEACTLGPHPAPDPSAVVCAGEEKPAPVWASCLKPPELRPTRRSGASQCLAEVRGKGAELFARRQTRMERFTIEAPPASERQPRPTSPTASLPPSWRCGGGPGPSSRPSGLVGGSSRPSGLAGGSSFAFRGRAAALPGLRRLGSASPPPVCGAPGPRPELTRASPLPPPPPAAKPPGPRLNSPDTRPMPTTQGPPQAAHRPTEAPQAPRPTKTPQAPRPTFSARRAGLEAQEGKSPVTPPWKTAGEGRRSSTRTYLDTMQSDPASGTALGSPPCPLSPTAGVLSPTSWTPPRSNPAAKLGSEVADSRRLKDLLAKNVVSAARRKKLSSPTLSPSSPGGLPFPLSPRSNCLSPLSPLSPSTPSPASLARSPIRMYRRSLTDSEFSLGSDDSGTRSPSYHNFCPRGWTGSRAKQSEQ